MRTLVVLEFPGTRPLSPALRTFGAILVVGGEDEAIARCSMGGVDLVVLRHLPGRLDGPDFARRLRGVSSGTEVLIVVEPGTPPDSTSIAASAEGCFLAHEPLLPGQLERACHRILRFARRYRRLFSGWLGLPCGGIQVAPLTVPGRRSIH